MAWAPGRRYVDVAGSARVGCGDMLEACVAVCNRVPGTSREGAAMPYELGHQTGCGAALGLNTRQVSAVACEVRVADGFV